MKQFLITFLIYENETFMWCISCELNAAEIIGENIRENG